MNRDKQDEELKQALQCIYDNIEIPNSTNSFLKVQARLHRRKRRMKWISRAKISVAILIGSFVVGLLLDTTPSTAYSQISSLFKVIQREVIEIFHESPSNQNRDMTKPSPPMDVDETVNRGSGQMIIVPLEEAKAMASFRLLIPSYVPESFQLETVRLFDTEDKSHYNHVLLEYANPDGELLNIIQREIEGESTGLKVEMAIDSGEHKDVFINENPAILMIPIEGNTNLEWLTKDRILIRISGKLSEPEIIRLATSLK